MKSERMKNLKKLISIFLAVIMIITATGLISLAATEQDKPFENSEYFTIGDYQIHYRKFEVDNAKGQVFLIHGFGLSTYSFENMILQLNNAGYSCVAADIPSFGYSTRETFDMELMSREDLMFSLMTSLNDDDWILAGHSMGGGIALNMATMFKDSGKISSLILFCPATMNGIPGFAKDMMASSTVATACEIFFRIGTRFNSIFKLMLLFSVNDSDFCENYDIIKISQPLQIKGTGKSICVSSAHANETDFSTVSQLEIPTLLFTAENDNVVTDTSDIYNSLEKTGKLTYYEVKGGGHMAHENKAPEMAEVIVEFLEK